MIRDNGKLSMSNLLVRSFYIMSEVNVAAPGMKLAKPLQPIESAEFLLAIGSVFGFPAITVTEQKIERSVIFVKLGNFVWEVHHISRKLML